MIHNFKAVFLIDRGKNSWSATPLQSKTTVAETFYKTWRAFFLGSPGCFHWNDWTQSMTRYHFWLLGAREPFPCWCYFCSKFSIFVKSVKIVWHEPNDMPTPLVISVLVIRRLSKINFFTALMFWMVVDVFGQTWRASSLTVTRPSLKNS